MNDNTSKEGMEIGRAAKRDYLLSGALAMTAAVFAVVFESSSFESGVRGGGLIAIAVVAALMYGRVAYGLLRRDAEDDQAGPSLDRMRRMAVIWYALGGVLAASMLRRPFASFQSFGLSGLSVAEWVAGVVGVGLVVAAGWRAIASISEIRRGLT